MVHALTLMTTDPQVRRVFDVATHKVEYTHDMASVQQRHLDARNACVVDFEKALRLAARRPRQAAGARPRGGAGLHALISGLIQNWLLDPEAFDLVPTGRRTFRVYLAGLGFVRPAAGAPVEREPKH
jgi:TetR/AcrR family acrAB operon transcriptional repressor